MPSIQPTPDNDFLITNDTLLDPPTLNLIFGAISALIKAQQAKVADYEAAIQQVTDLGLEMIGESLAPQILAARNEVIGLQALVAELEDKIAQIATGAVSATNVGETLLRVFVTPAQRAEIAQLRIDLDAVGNAFIQLVESLASVAKLNVDQLWSKPQRAQQVAVVSASTITLDAVAGNDFHLPGLAHNATLANIQNAANHINQKGSFTGQQDATGGRTLAFASNWYPVGGNTVPSLPAAPNAKFRIEYHIVAADRTDFALLKVAAT